MTANARGWVNKKIERLWTFLRATEFGFFQKKRITICHQDVNNCQRPIYPASGGFLSCRFYFLVFSWLSLPLLFSFTARKNLCHDPITFPNEHAPPLLIFHMNSTRGNRHVNRAFSFQSRVEMSSKVMECLLDECVDKFCRD